tara:strand:- start:7061 stop:9229 length:2169 start_codon:yes stop_codon:yes gene_type:complete
MSGPGEAVGGGNDPFAGGTLARAGQPTAASGAFRNPGAGGFPQPGTPGILSARNNSGSNVRIPYARLVPLSNRQNKGLVTSGPLNGRSLQNEYDGLESGELGWILGRRFVAEFPTDPSTSQNAVFMRESAHGLGMGKGVDRMQRLASTVWHEAFFQNTFSDVVIELDKLMIVNNVSDVLAPEIKHFENALAGATVLGSVDLPHLYNSLFKNDKPNEGNYLKYFDDNVDLANVENGTIMNNGQNEIAAPAPRSNTAKDGYSTGLFVMEKGPFLRGKIVDDQPVDVLNPESRSAVTQSVLSHSQPRNLGDALAFEALYAQLRAKSFFDWSPDGMILSKLDSPAGDPYSSAELDARQAQLFNVAIQGPALAKTWTGDPRMQTMPMDKVFVVIIADVVSKVTNSETDGLGNSAQTAALWNAYGAWVNGDSSSNEAPRSATLSSALSTALAEAKQAVVNPENADLKAYENALKAYKLALNNYNNATSKAAKDAEQRKMKAEMAVFDGYFNKIKDDAWDSVAAEVKRGTKGVKNSIMTNFRIKRVTSAYLSQYSKYIKGDDSSRCGLKIGTKTPDATKDNYDVVAAEYIIGGWCVHAIYCSPPTHSSFIHYLDLDANHKPSSNLKLSVNGLPARCIGTVLDNAASRSTVGHQVRTAPASMALNINVNIEWWSGDKLYRNFMDVDGTVLRRDMYMNSDDTKLHAAGQKVAGANKREKTAVLQEMNIVNA